MIQLIKPGIFIENHYIHRSNQLYPSIKALDQKIPIISVKTTRYLTETDLYFI